MARYLVFKDATAQRGDGVTFVRDGFHVLAFIVPVVWLAWHRLWLQAALMFAVMGLIAWATGFFVPGSAAALTGLTNLALGYLTALEGPAWLGRSKASESVILAHSSREAEEIYASHLPDVEPSRTPIARGFQTVSQASLIPLTGSV